MEEEAEERAEAWTTLIQGSCDHISAHPKHSHEPSAAAVLISHRY